MGMDDHRRQGKDTARPGPARTVPDRLHHSKGITTMEGHSRRDTISTTRTHRHYDTAAKAATASSSSSNPHHYATTSLLLLHLQATAKVHHPRATTTALQSPTTNARPQPLPQHPETATTATPSGPSSCKSTKTAPASSQKKNCAAPSSTATTPPSTTTRSK